MFFHWKYLRFGVEVVYGGHGERAGYYSESFVLNCLKREDVVVACARVPDGGSVVHDGFNQFVSCRPRCFGGRKYEDINTRIYSVNLHGPRG